MVRIAVLISGGGTNLQSLIDAVNNNYINGDGKKSYGLIAQQVVKAMEELGIEETELELVTHDFCKDEETGEERDGYGIAYNNLIAMLIKEVQDLKAEVRRLKGE